MKTATNSQITPEADKELVRQATVESHSIRARVPLLAALRPSQWTKNLLLFAALLFSIRFTQLNAWYAAILAFVVFCAFSSAGYIINDLLDAEADRQHPAKRLRPIAS